LEYLHISEIAHIVFRSIMIFKYMWFTNFLLIFHGWMYLEDTISKKYTKHIFFLFQSNYSTFWRRRNFEPMPLKILPNYSTGIFDLVRLVSIWLILKLNKITVLIIGRFILLFFVLNSFFIPLNFSSPATVYFLNHVLINEHKWWEYIFPRTY